MRRRFHFQFRAPAGLSRSLVALLSLFNGGLHTVVWVRYWRSRNSNWVQGYQGLALSKQLLVTLDTSEC